MKERPILFSGPMIRAILEGRKTVTRRIVRDGENRVETVGDTDKPSLVHGLGCEPPCDYACKAVFLEEESGQVKSQPSPYGTSGDRLWVKETWAAMKRSAAHETAGKLFDEVLGPIDGATGHVVAYRTDGYDVPFHPSRWRSSRYMPRWASRLTLEVVSVRVERLQEITAEDARAEGIVVPRCDCEPCRMTSAICTADQSVYLEDFRGLWDLINGKRAPWDSNPWVWRVEFGVTK